MTSVESTRESAGWRDFLELCKPAVVVVMIVTSLIGMFLAVPGMVPVDVLVLGNLGIALSAASAATVNHLVDRQLDMKMARTLNRPLAQGRVEPAQAVIFAAVLGIIGMTILVVYINVLTAWLTLASLLGYAVVYTIYLKRATPQNIVIGGLAGAAPPLLGWTAVTNQIDPQALLLVLIVFIWTPPHFWALAIHRKAEYAKADVPMLPVTHGESYTKLHILLYTIVLIPVTVFPWLVGMSGWMYLLGALVLGSGFIYWAIVLMVSDKPDLGMATFRYSIIYLLTLFAIMLVDHHLVEASLPVTLTMAIPGGLAS